MLKREKTIHTKSVFGTAISWNICVILKIVPIKEIICYKQIVILKINFIYPSVLGSHLDTEASNTGVFSRFVTDTYEILLFWCCTLAVNIKNSWILFGCFQC